MHRCIAAALAAALALPAAAPAQDAEQGQAGPVERRDGVYLQSAEDMDVRTADGDKIGEVEEILVDEQGRPAGFLIEIGGWLGLGDDDVVVPIGALTWDGSAYVSTMTETQLDQLQPFDE